MQKRILVVSDSAMTRVMISSRLEAEKFDVFSAEEPSAALEGIRSGKTAADLAILSLEMYEAQTPRLIAGLRSCRGFESKPVLTITGNGTLTENELMRAGATWWMEKPFTGDELVRLVKLMLI